LSRIDKSFEMDWKIKTNLKWQNGIQQKLLRLKLDKMLLDKIELQQNGTFPQIRQFDVKCDNIK